MKAMVLGCLMLVCSAAAHAEDLPVCSASEIAAWEKIMADVQRHPEQLPFRGPGVTEGPGITCNLPGGAGSAPRDSRTGGFDGMMDLRDHFGDDQTPDPDAGIDRSNEPCWINFPQKGDDGFGSPLQEGRDYGFCSDAVPSTIDFPRPEKPRPDNGKVGPERPAGDRRPRKTRDDEDRDWYRRRLLESLPRPTDMFGDPFGALAPTRQFDVPRDGVRQLLGGARHSASTPQGVSPSLNLSIPRDGAVAATPLPVWQPRQAPVNLLDPGMSLRDTGCGRGPMAAC
jgi:hypothetical protein